MMKLWRHERNAQPIIDDLKQYGAPLLSQSENRSSCRQGPTIMISACMKVIFMIGKVVIGSFHTLADIGHYLSYYVI